MNPGASRIPRVKNVRSPIFVSIASHRLTTTTTEASKTSSKIHRILRYDQALRSFTTYRIRKIKDLQHSVPSITIPIHHAPHKYINTPSLSNKYKRKPVLVDNAPPPIIISTTRSSSYHARTVPIPLKKRPTEKSNLDICFLAQPYHFKREKKEKRKVKVTTQPPCRKSQQKKKNPFKQHLTTGTLDKSAHHPMRPLVGVKLDD